ncbi:DinB family protein [Devosia sp.]|uniref:DinB family protein n=1 Tax=Devosia sp. TaxID=1871048 RepID=UPI002FCBF9EC
MGAALLDLYGYHAWANRDLLEALEPLPDPAASTARRILNHAFVVAEIFSAHLQSTGHSHKVDNTRETPSLESLRQGVTALDRWYLNYVHHLSSGDLAEFVPFVFTDGDKGYMSRSEILMHVVLHTAIHRGEVERLLSQHSITPPWDTFAVYLHSSQPARRRQEPSAAPER